jgi:hypothetical protein
MADVVVPHIAQQVAELACEIGKIQMTVRINEHDRKFQTAMKLRRICHPFVIASGEQPTGDIVIGLAGPQSSASVPATMLARRKQMFMQ